MSEMVDQVARVLGEYYDGYADPVDTPENWARAVQAAKAAIEVIRLELLADVIAHNDLKHLFATLDVALS